MMNSRIEHPDFSPILTSEELSAELTNKKITLFVPSITNIFYFRYLLRVIDLACKNSSKIVLLDCNWQTKYMAHSYRVFSSSSKTRDEFFLTLIKKYPNSLEIIKISEDDISPAEEISGIAKITEELSIKSIMMSMNIDVYANESEYARDIIKYMKILFRKNYQLSCDLIPGSDLVIFLNGRWPEQAAVRAFCESAGAKFLSLEHGKPNGMRFHLQNFQTQEYAKMRLYFESLLGMMSSKNMEASLDWGSEWLAKQSGDAESNPHLILKSFVKKETKLNGKVVSIFNSSFDERFSNLGIELNEWQNQEEAITTVACEFRKKGFLPIVRIHPNTINKGWREICTLVGALEKFDIPIVLPWNEPSTYELIDMSDFVVTWGSTVAIESTARGVPTLNLGRTSYDTILDVVIISKSNFKNIIESKFDLPSPKKSLIAAYLTRNWGFDLEDFNLESDLVKLDSKISNTDFWNIPEETDSSKRRKHYIGRFLDLFRLRDFVMAYRKSNISRGRMSPADLYRLLGIVRNIRLRNYIMTLLFNCYRKLLRLKS